MKVELPPRVTFIKRTLGPGMWDYCFAHSDLGPIGRVLLTELPDGRRTHLSCEVALNPDPARMADRRALFESLGLEISQRLEEELAARHARSPSPRGDPE